MTAGLALAVAAGVLVWTQTRATGVVRVRSCSWYAAASHDRQLHPSGNGRRTVVIGDSYSLGSGMSDTSRGWTSRLPGRVQVFGFGGTGFSRDSGRCGPAESFAARAPAALATRPQLVVVEGGLNDVDQSTASIRTGFDRLVAEVGARPVLVIGPARAPSRAAGALRVDAILRDLAARAGWPYLSMVGYDFSYLHDRLHLDLAGHVAYAAVVRRALADLGAASFPVRPPAREMQHGPGHQVRGRAGKS